MTGSAKIHGPAAGTAGHSATRMHAYEISRGRKSRSSISSSRRRSSSLGHSQLACSSIADAVSTVQRGLIAEVSEDIPRMIGAARCGLDVLAPQPDGYEHSQETVG